MLQAEDVEVPAPHFSFVGQLPFDSTLTQPFSAWCRHSALSQTPWFATFPGPPPLAAEVSCSGSPERFTALLSCFITISGS